MIFHIHMLIHPAVGNSVGATCRTVPLVSCRFALTVPWLRVWSPIDDVLVWAPTHYTGSMGAHVGSA